MQVVLNRMNTHVLLASSTDIDDARICILDDLKRCGVLAQAIGGIPIF